MTSTLARVRTNALLSFLLSTCLGASAITTCARDGATFTWLKGKGAPVCEQYKSYVESIEDPLDIHHGERTWDQKLMCARTIPARFYVFTQPMWRELDPGDRVPMMVSIFDNLSYDVQNYPGFEKIAKDPRHIEAIISSLKLNHENGHYRWYLANADIDNDGKPETIVKWRKGRCNRFAPDSQHYSIPILIMDPQDAVNGKLSRRVINQGAYPGLAIGAASLDVFQYAGKTYVDRWDNEGDDHGIATHDKRLSVFLHEGDRTSLQCKFRF
jgi:hypothetical protein